jgi:CheY-like chemotaxis protein
MVGGRALSRGGRTILVVEDNADHAVLVRLAARRVDPLLDVRIASDGVEAVAYLAGDSPFGDRLEHPFPELVLLDLAMPRLDGLGVLSWVATRPDLSHLPIVVLTSSASPGDEARSLAAGARSFHTKPADLTELGEQVRGVVERWVG